MKYLAVLFVCNCCLFAADQAWFRLLGFSGDGKYLAWEEGGVQDGSGFPWLRVVVLDTEISTEVESTYQVWEDELEGPKIGYFEGSRTDLLMEFGIDTPPGEPLVYRPVTDLSVQGDSMRFCLEYYCPGFWSGEYVMRLEQTPMGYEDGYPDWFPQPVLLSLSVSDTEFFKEEQPAGEYRSVFGYCFAGIFLNPFESRRPAVVLHAASPGFEGADGRFRVVSGVLP